MYCKKGSKTVIPSTSWGLDPTTVGCRLWTDSPAGMAVFHGAEFHR